MVYGFIPSNPPLSPGPLAQSLGPPTPWKPSPAREGRGALEGVPGGDRLIFNRRTSPEDPWG